MNILVMQEYLDSLIDQNTRMRECLRTLYEQGDVSADYLKEWDIEIPTD
jgi:hypothetical protein